eukprot:5388842-Amphidinium_carterae.1
MTCTPLFYILFILDEVLELTTQAFRVYYTIDAYQVGFQRAFLHPGCEDDDFALNIVEGFACIEVFEELPVCNSSDANASDPACIEALEELP